MNDDKLQSEMENIIKLLHDSILEFTETKVAQDANSYVNHFMSILNDVTKTNNPQMLELEGTRFVQAYENLHQKLRDEYLSSVEEVNWIFEHKTIGVKLYNNLDRAIENKMNDVAAPVFKQIMGYVKLRIK